MKTITKIYIASTVCAILALAIIGGSAWSKHKFSKLENAVEAAKQRADGRQQLAEQKEIESAAYLQKIEYLENQISAIKDIAKKQDEELEKLNTNSRNVRDSVERAKRTRSIAATNAELCAKLAELGHACR